MKIRHMLIALTLLGAGTANAAGDVAIGKKKAETCMGCHAVKGYFNVYPSYKVPKVAGQNATFIENALKDYRDGTRVHATMKANAANLSDQDIADIAAFFAAEQYETAESSNPQSAALVALGKEKSASCAACHGAAGIAANPMWPTLAGQHPSYIINALESYQDGRRNDPTMQGMAAALNDDDREALAAYFSSLPGGVQSLKMPKKIK